MTQHLTALHTYRQRLATLVEQEQVLARTQQARNADNHIERLIHNTGQDDIARDELACAATTVDDAAKARSAALQELRGDYLNQLHVADPD